MNSLTKTATIIRRVTIIFLVAAVLVLTVDFLIKLIESAPTPPPTSVERWLFFDNLLGSVPRPTMDSIPISSESTPTFAVDGDFPSGASAPSTALVYEVNPPVFTLGSEDQAIDTAAALGFFGDYEQQQRSTGSQLFTWQREEGVRTLTYEILPNEFERWRLITQFNFDASAQRPKSVNSDTTFYSNRAQGLLNTLGFALPTLQDGVSVATAGKLGADGLLRQPVSITSADYVDVQTYHAVEIARPSQAGKTLDYESLTGKVYRNSPRTGSLSMTVSDEASDTANDIYNIDHLKFEIDTSNIGVYNIVSYAEAWERVRSGLGSLTLLQLQPFDRFQENQPNLNVKTFTADAVSSELAYFIPDTWDGLIYPIYVFSGRVDTADGQVGRFTFYVDALDRLD